MLINTIAYIAKYNHAYSYEKIAFSIYGNSGFWAWKQILKQLNYAVILNMRFKTIYF